MTGRKLIRDHGVTDRDVVVGIAGSGRTPYVLGGLEEAHRIGGKTIFLCCTPPADSLKAFVDVFIVPVVGPEIITGSTRLKTGTVTKLVLNMLTTVSMIQIGKVYNNLMVDIQASNAKLIDRGGAHHYGGYGDGLCDGTNGVGARRWQCENRDCYACEGGQSDGSRFAIGEKRWISAAGIGRHLLY